MQTIGMDRDEAIKVGKLINITPITMTFQRLNSWSTTISIGLLRRIIPGEKWTVYGDELQLSLNDVALLLQFLGEIDEKLLYDYRISGRDEWLVEVGYHNTMLVVRKDLSEAKEGEVQGPWHEMIAIALQDEQAS